MQYFRFDFTSSKPYYNSWLDSRIKSPTPLTIPSCTLHDSTKLFQMHNLMVHVFFKYLPSLLSKPSQIQTHKEHQRKDQEKFTLVPKRKMVPGFNRSISLPLSPSRAGKNGRAASKHVRSVSLPCQSHPIISNLEEQIRAIRSFSANPAEATFVWIEAGLCQIDTLLTALEEFLHLGQTQETLSQATSTDNLLEDFLLLADIYSSFVSTIATLKQHQAEVQSAIRRADKICLFSALKSQRDVEKEITQLISYLKNISKCRPLGLASNASEAEITEILAEAVRVTAVASMALFSGVVATSATASLTKTSSMTRLFRKLTLNSSTSDSRVSDEEFGVAEKFEQLELCVGNVESCSERVYRRLINLRVSLLNISTPSL